MERKIWAILNSTQKIGVSRFYFFLIFIFCCFPPFSTFAQEKGSVKYEVIVLGIKIGEVQANRSLIAGDTLIYQTDSQVKFWFFGSVDLQFQNKSYFLKNQIVKAYSSSRTNRGNYFSTILWKGDSYQVDAETYKFENKKPLNGPISWCSTKLFFEEPRDGDVFLSEVYGLSQKIKEIEPSAYEIEINGNINRYYYQSGKLEKIVLENPIKNYQIRRVK